jgi:hypothetical protein
MELPINFHQLGSTSRAPPIELHQSSSSSRAPYFGFEQSGLAKPIDNKKCLLTTSNILLQIKVHIFTIATDQLTSRLVQAGLRSKHPDYAAIHVLIDLNICCAQQVQHDTEGIRTPAARGQWISSPSP